MYSGILIIDKPTGLTSHDVVARVRRILGTKKVGHAGTLDPDASGVLVLCVGDATRILEYLTADDKVYTGEVVFGIGTDTDDASGATVSEADASGLNESKLVSSTKTFLGEIEQTPPQYSAIHINGKRAYELAREGTHVEIPSRHVTITEFSLFHFTPGTVAKAKFRVECSKGTYIRSLCRDLGQSVQVPAHMSQLRRLRSGTFSLRDAVTISELEQSSDKAALLIDPVNGLSMPKIVVPESVCLKLAQGQSVSLPAEAGELTDGKVAATLSAQGELVAIVEPRLGTRYVKPKKVFWKREAP